MRGMLFVIVFISGLSIALGLFLYTATPDVSIFTLMGLVFALLAVLFAVPVGFFLSLRRYILALIVCALIVLAVPLMARAPIEDLACNVRGRTPIADLPGTSPGSIVNICGELVSCQVEQLGFDGSSQEVCYLRDTGDGNATIAFYNYTLLDRTRNSQQAINTNEEQRLRDTDAGTLIVREGIFYDDLLEGCMGLPGMCALQPLPLGEVYSNPAIYSLVRESPE